MLQIVRPAACQQDNLTITNGTLKAPFQRPAPIRHYIGINLSPNKPHNQRQPMLELPILNNANIKTPKDKSTMMPTPLIRSKPSPVFWKPSLAIHQPNKRQPVLLRWLRAAIPGLIVQRFRPPLLGPRFYLHDLTLYAARTLRVKDEAIELRLVLLLLCTCALDGRHGRKW